MLEHLHFSQASKLILITPGAENHGCNSGAFTSWYRKEFTLQSVTVQGAVLEDMRAGGAYSLVQDATHMHMKPYMMR